MWLSASRAYSGAPLRYITTSPLPNGAIGANYALLFQASGGVPAYAAIVQSQTGSNVWAFSNTTPLLLQCTPTVAETDTLNIVLSDQAGNTLPGVFVVTISAIAFVIDSSGNIVTDSAGQPVTSQ